MEQVLNDQIVKQISEAFAGMQEPVQVLYFGTKHNCEYCAETQQLLKEVTTISDKIELSVYDIQEHQDIAANRDQFRCWVSGRRGARHAKRKCRPSKNITILVSLKNVL